MLQSALGVGLARIRGLPMALKKDMTRSSRGESMSEESEINLEEVLLPSACGSSANVGLKVLPGFVAAFVESGFAPVVESNAGWLLSWY